MKIAGKKISGANIEYVVIPRSDGEDIVFKLQAICNMEEFEKLCKEPTPPKIRGGKGQLIEDIEDRGYKGELEQYRKQKMAWSVLQSLKPSEIEWETVNLSDPSTWLNYEQELKDAGFSQGELNRIYAGFTEVNCLNEEKLEEARQRFLLTLQPVKSE